MSLIRITNLTRRYVMGTETVVESGLEGNETVVTNGHLLLTNGARVAIRKAGA